MLQVSTGTEPWFNLKYTRTTKSLDGGKESTFEVEAPIVKELKGKVNDKVFVTSQQIKWQDRIDLQAAIQKHVDTAISSTINLPRETTLEEIEQIYLYAWVHGLKGLTIFRDGCREGILNNIGTTSKEIKPTPKYDYIMPISRKKMGDTYGCTACKKSACGTLYVTCNKDKDGNFVELFTHTSKGGVCQANLNAVTRGISLALRSGVKIDEIIDQLKGIHCPACSNAKAKGQKIDGLSCPDIIAKVMQNFIKGTKDSKPKEVKEESTDKCPECGAVLVHEGGCVTCTSCGYSKCN